MQSQEDPHLNFSMRWRTAKTQAAILMTPLVVLSVCWFLTFTAPSLQGQTFSVIYNIPYGPGGCPWSLKMDRAGNLYGTTTGCDQLPWYGSVYKLSKQGSQWVGTMLETLEPTGGGGSWGLTIGPNGRLYGATHYNNLIFDAAPSPRACATAPCSWIEAQLYQFAGGADGSSSNPGLALDVNQNIYGSTPDGGIVYGDCYSMYYPGCGTVYRLRASNGSWLKDILYSFTGAGDGLTPTAGVVLGPDGRLYGTTQYGGYNCLLGSGCGTVFRLTPSQGGWTEQVLHSFQGRGDGMYPTAGLALDAAGNIYGTTQGSYDFGDQTVFRLSPSGGYEVLFDFGNYPEVYAGFLVIDAWGNVYGTTANGGSGAGTVFKLTPGDGRWTYSTLHEFTEGADGGHPTEIVLDRSGNIYGVTYSGVVFEITQ